MLPIEPLGEYLLVTPLDAGAPAAGLALPASANRDRPRRAVVLAAGPGRRVGDGRRIRPAVGTGDVVVLGACAGTDIRVGSVGLVLVRESDMLAHLVD